MAWRTTPENRGEVVQRFFHASKQEARVVVAELRPTATPPQRDVVTAVAAARGDARTVATGLPMAPTRELPPAVHPANHPLEGEADPDGPPPAPPAVPPDDAEPLTADLRRLHITVSKRFLAKLEAARDALAHSHPAGDAEAVLEAALDLLLEKHARKKGFVKKPRAAPALPSPRPRHIPAEVRRTVWKRDGGRCQYRLASGEICGATRRLQLDHLVPVARGGPSTVENLRITCAAHNLLAARQAFGDAWMDRFAGSSAAVGTPPP